MRYLFILLTVFAASVVRAEVLIIPNPFNKDVIVLGEVHDNPTHHQVQAQVMAQIWPTAIVFEMLTREQAGLITSDNRLDEDELRDVLGWDDTGWPDFSYYYPVIAALNETQIYGAGLTRAGARKAFETGIVENFGAEAALYGLDQPLSASEQSEREAFQREAHCNALPENLLARMVDLQRLRDAYLARAVVEALDAVGGRVVVITGNGHARKDRGLAVYLEKARPGVRVYSVGLTEHGRDIDGRFDKVLGYAPHPRPDPCLAFQKRD